MHIHSDLKTFKEDHLLKEYCCLMSEKLKKIFEKTLSFGADLNSKSNPRKQKTQIHISTVLLTPYDHGLSNESPYTSGFSFARWQSWNGWFLRPICNLLCCNFFIIDIHCDLQRDENFEQSFWFKVFAQRYCSQVQWILIRELAVAEDKLQWPPPSSLSWGPDSRMFFFGSTPYSLGWSLVTQKHFFSFKLKYDVVQPYKYINQPIRNDFECLLPRLA